jgi:hypothetical protein
VRSNRWFTSTGKPDYVARSICKLILFCSPSTTCPSHRRFMPVEFLFA